MRMRCCLLLLALLATTAPSWAWGERFLHLGLEQGLAHSTVWTVAQGERGDLWVATEAALQRWDGYRFSDYLHDPDDPTSLSSSEVMVMTVDREGHLWLATRQDGLNRYDATTDRFVRYLGPTSPAVGETPRRLFNDLFEDSAGTLWIGTGQGLYSLDAERRHFAHHPFEEGESGAPGNIVITLEESSDGTLWVGTADGLVELSSAGEVVARHLDWVEPDDPTAMRAVTALLALENGELWMGTNDGAIRRVPWTDDEERASWSPLLTLPAAVTQLEVWEGMLWAATYGGGLARIDLADGESTLLRHDPLDPTSLASDRVITLVTDRSGGLWIATREGLHQLHRDRRRFEVLSHRGRSAPLGGGVVLGLEEDRRGELWVSGDGWVRVIDREAREWRGIEPTTVSGRDIGQIEEILEDGDSRVWLGGGEGLFYVDPPSSELRAFEPLAAAAVRCMIESAAGEIWIGRSGGEGIDLLDPSTGELSDHLPTEGVVYALLEDRQGRLWAGLSEGLDRHDTRGGEPVHFRHDPDDPTSLGHASVAALLEDRQGTIWIGQVGAGLARFDEVEQDFEHFRTRDGLPHDNVVGLLEDPAGMLWIATHGGLSRFDPDRRSFRNFGAGDGLAANAFLIGPALADRGGELIFGAAGGLTIFDPSAFGRSSYEPPVAITSVTVDGEPVAIHPGETLELGHRQKAVTFELAAFDYSNPARLRYRHRMRGYDDWSVLDARHRRARYTNLDPGGYVFEVQAATPGGDWSEPGATIALRVHPSPWRSPWAYLLYGLGLVGAVLAYLRTQRLELELERATAERERQIAERERAVSRRLRAVDKLKDEFLANTSHELRTPLFGITGLAESLLAGAAGELSESARENLELIVASGQRLGHLVNDILDFSKMRHESLQLSRTAVDLRPLVDVVLALSRPLAGNKPIELSNHVPEDLPPVSADENRLIQILQNLLGNAVKFTEEGSVKVEAATEGERVVVRVSDTGPGIPDSERERIFEAFEQIEGTTERMARGTGLGLAVTRQLVELHGGSIKVESVESVGSVFVFDLPVADSSTLEALTTADAAAGSTEVPAKAALAPTWASDQGLPVSDAERRAVPEHLADDVGPADQAEKTAALEEGALSEQRIVGRILVVDDEPINRRILSQHLSSEGHRVSSAASGPEALEKIARESFHLVLLDVMMPRMSGFEVCRTLRRDFALDELPVIFLTAKGQVQDLVVGLAAGANDYLSKPVGRSELLARVKTHLALLGVHRRLSRVLEERSEEVEERGRLLREREQLIGELEERHAELARFNYTVSHDLKNPLVTIRNFLGRLRSGLEGGGNERFEEDLGRLDRAADDMQRLLEDLDKFSRAGSQDGSLVPVDLGGLTRAVASGMDGRLADGREIELVIADSLPVVVGDRVRLAEALRQLLDNAMRFSEETPQPRIEIGARHQDGAVVLTMADNGIGVDPRYQEKIFELFHRLDPGSSAGTGVGLALVRRIVEAHGGRVWVESEGIGHGSTFCIRLPIGLLVAEKASDGLGDEESHAS